MRTQTPYRFSIGRTPSGSKVFRLFLCKREGPKLLKAIGIPEARLIYENFKIFHIWGKMLYKNETMLGEYCRTREIGIRVEIDIPKPMFWKNKKAGNKFKYVAPEILAIYLNRYYLMDFLQENFNGKTPLVLDWALIRGND